MKKIQVLGTGCSKCENLYKATEAAVKELGEGYELSKVTEINEILDFGVMIVPALAVDGIVKMSGKVPSIEEIKKVISL
ncbi:MAG: TM0996/MTH895 family glutaredoxin-like protein [Fibrobacteres bacterium]|nr:TM0996/MTH895 family glutaredoxin-like protein [Fibrobacterota bacterium]